MGMIFIHKKSSLGKFEVGEEVCNMLAHETLSSLQDEVYCGEGIAPKRKRKKTWHRSPSFFNSPTQTSLIFSLKNNPRSPAAYVSADDPDVNMPSANFLSVTSLTCSVMTTGEFA